MSTKLFSTSAVAYILIFASSFGSIFDDENESQEASAADLLELYDRQMQEAFGELNLGKDYFEGDMLLTKHQRDSIQKYWQDTVDNTPVVRDFLQNGFLQLWLNNTVPYTIAPKMREASLTNIRAAIKEWQDKLCIVFKERRFEDDYVEFAYEGGCSSSIGRIGGRQVVSVGSVGTEYADMSCRSPTPYGSNVTITCSKGSIMHEIGHALGFYHEQNRPDRDMYVTIVWDNVMPGCRVNFRKERFLTIYGQDVPYDYNSVMHYGSFFFARERGMRTLHAKVKGVNIGQRERLSSLDIQKGRLLYQCDKERGSTVVGVK